jgi:hypothetical protein
MNLNDFFSSSAVSLPRGGFETANCTFDVFLERLFSAYIGEVKKISDPEHHGICETVERSIPEIENIARRIVKAAKYYLQGYPHQAYLEIKNTLRYAEFDALTTEVSSFSPSAPPVPFDFHLESILHPVMYRMRSNFGLARAGTLKKKDIFHVPFENRNLVQNQRYSIAGLPCLYLGSSTWICWEELNRPELRQCIYSRFKFAKKTKILDFQLPPANAWKVYSNVRAQSLSSDPPPRTAELETRYNEKFVISYILYWPLIAASSIRVDTRKGAFFPQYILPQLLLQWVSKERTVDGIRYFSTRTPAVMNFYVNVNYVFPVRNIKHAGRCSDLREKIHLVTPMLWGMMEMINVDNRMVYTPGILDNRVGMVELSESAKFSYVQTMFYEMERRLAALEPDDSFGPVEP